MGAQKEYLEVAAARVLIYRSFQFTFGNEPNASGCDALCESLLPQAFAIIDDTSCTNTYTPLAPFNACLDAYRTDPKNALDIWRSEYTRLFIGPSRLPAPPWESVYVSGDRVLFQASTMEVRGFYQKFGYMTLKHPRVPDDHVGIELDFMANLANELYQSLVVNDIEMFTRVAVGQQAFLKNHLLNWIGAFTDDLASCLTDKSLYCCAAKLLLAFLQMDARIIEQMILLSPA